MKLNQLLCCIDHSRQIDGAALPKPREHDDADGVPLASVGLGEEEYVVAPNANLKMAGTCIYTEKLYLFMKVLKPSCASLDSDSDSPVVIRKMALGVT